MKLNEIYGAPTHDRIPVSMTYEVYDEHAEEYVEIEIEADVLVTKDAYGTGDSPTEYEVTNEKARFVKTGKPFDLNTLSEKERRHIEDTLAEKAQ